MIVDWIGVLRILARGEEVVMKHGFNVFAVAHTREDNVRVYVCDPPDDEGVWFTTVDLMA